MARGADLEAVQKCDLCDSSQFLPELSANGWSLVRCASCGLVFTSPRYSEAYVRRMYETRYYERAQGYLSSQLEDPLDAELCLARSLFKRCAGANSPAPPRMLDVGCGGARIVRTFQQCGWEAVGIDISAEATSEGRSRGLDLRCTGIQDKGLGDFDLVCAFHVLEHVHSPKEFILQSRNRLRKNGYLLLEVPNYASYRARNMRERWPYLYPDSHLYQFTPLTLEEYVRRHGFSVVETRRIGGRGPLEDYKGSVKSSIRGNRLKDVLFSLRHLLHVLPGCRDMMRNLVWDTLGYGEFVRVLARFVKVVKV